jgi:hypothetical protein
MVHLDHLLSLWPKIFGYHNCVRIGTFQWLIDLMGEDKMTDWELRYYVSTGQADKASEYGNCESPEAIRDAELAQLRYHAKQHDNITVLAEIYGENTAWVWRRGEQHHAAAHASHGVLAELAYRHESL